MAAMSIPPSAEQAIVRQSPIGPIGPVDHEAPEFVETRNEVEATSNKDPSADIVT